MYLSNKNKFRIYYLYYKDKNTNKIKKISTKTKLKNEALKFVNSFNPDERKDENVLKIYSLSELKDYVLKYTSQNYTASTNQIYRNTLNKFVGLIGNKRLNSLTINDIEFYKAERLKSINKVTLNIEIRTLKAIFNLAIKWNALKINPCKFVSQYIVNEKEKLSFDDEDLEKVLLAIKDDTIKKIVLFALYTGCRINEILNIQWSDIDFVQKIISIRNKANFKTKTGRIRQIPISEKLQPILSEIYQNRFHAENKILKLNENNGYVFLNKKGVKYEYTCVTMDFKKYLRLAGIDEKYHFHCLRHTFITNLIKRGVNINFVKEIAGHTNISTTMNYIHIVTEDLRAAVNQI